MKKNHLLSVAIMTLIGAVIAAAIACKNPIKDKVEEINASEAPSLVLSVGSATVASGGSYNMGATALATTRTRTFTLSNSGKSDLEASVSSSGNFSVASQPAGTIAPGSSSTFVVNFTPTSPEGVKSGTVTISSNDPKNESFSFTVTGLGSTIMLPKTGQTTSYTDGDNGTYQSGVSWPTPRFSAATAQTIIDNLTGLQWAKNANYDGVVSWDDAIDYIDTTLPNIDGLTGWRLPNKNELRSLINYARSDTATWLANQGFSNVKALLSDYPYWTSTTDASATSRAWYIALYDGSIASETKTTVYGYLWPVRTADTTSAIKIQKSGQNIAQGAKDDGTIQYGAEWPTTRFINKSDGTIIDKLTGLMWECAPPASTYNLLGAITRCKNLRTGGYNNWRIPNINELHSLLNASSPSAATYLHNTDNNWSLISAAYWTSTSYTVLTADNWTINLGDGTSIYDAKSGLFYSIAVREIE